MIRGEQSDPVGAVECFLQAWLFSPDYARASDHLGAVLRQLNRVDEAIIAFERACAIAFKNLEFKVHLGTAVSLNDDLDRAESLYNTSLEWQPNNPDGWVNLSVVFCQRQKFVGSEVALKQDWPLIPITVRHILTSDTKTCCWGILVMAGASIAGGMRI